MAALASSFLIASLPLSDLCDTLITSPEERIPPNKVGQTVLFVRILKNEDRLDHPAGAASPGTPVGMPVLQS